MVTGGNKIYVGPSFHSGFLLYLRGNSCSSLYPCTVQCMAKVSKMYTRHRGTVQMTAGNHK